MDNIRQYGTRAVPKLLEKVNIIDIVDDLTSGGTGVPLSAAQGKILKNLLGSESAARIQAIIDLKGSASASADTLGKLEGLISAEATAREAGDLAGADALAAQAVTLRSEFQAADVTLQSNLNNVQGQLQTAIDSETARAQAAESTLTDDLNQEISDRQTAIANEATARTNAILAEKTRAEAAESTLVASIASEQTRAEAAEATLVASIASEQTRAEAAEATLQTAITAEQSRAEGAEAVLQNNIDTERTQRQTTDTALDSRLAAIESGLVAGIRWKAVLPDMAALDALDELSQVAGWGFYVGVEKDVYVVIDSDQGDYQPATWNTKSFLKFADFAEVTGMVNAEKTRAMAAEASLSADISAEQTRATTAESTLTTNLSNEVSRATAAEQLVQSNLDTETARAIADVLAEKQRAENEEGRIEGLVAQEVTDRSNAIIAERTRAQSEEARIEALVATEVTNRIADVDEEQTRATQAEQVLTNGLNNEITNRQTAVTNEATSRADADNALSARADVLEGAEEVVGSVEWAYAQGRLYTAENVLRPKVEGAGGTLLVVGDTVTVSNAVSDGINGIVYGEVIIFAGDNDAEALSVNVASVSGSQLTLAVGTLNEFDGKKAKVSYFYRDSEQVGGGVGGAGTGKAGV